MAKKQKESNLISGLSGFLADIAVLSLKTKNFHWNVTGERFHQLHLLFEGIYTDLDTAIDEVAERIRALDSFAPGSFVEFLEITNIKECSGGHKKTNEMLKELYNDFQKLNVRTQEVMKLAQDQEDEATTDLMVGRRRVQDKTAWMLKSQLQ
jgi:starvation-inducible DNA-binding protein